MNSRLFKALRKRNVPVQTALAACRCTENKSLKKNTLSLHVYSIEAYTNMGFSRKQALEMRESFGLDAGCCLYVWWFIPHRLGCRRCWRRCYIWRFGSLGWQIKSTLIVFILSPILAFCVRDSKMIRRCNHWFGCCRSYFAWSVEFLWKINLATQRIDGPLFIFANNTPFAFSVEYSRFSNEIGTIIKHVSSYFEKLCKCELCDSYTVIIPEQLRIVILPYTAKLATYSDDILVGAIQTTLFASVDKTTHFTRNFCCALNIGWSRRINKLHYQSKFNDFATSHCLSSHSSSAC